METIAPNDGVVGGPKSENLIRANRREPLADNV